MYRHEAVEIARKMMELHGVTDELKPWVIDVVLKVANSETPPTPFAWFMPGEPQNGIVHQRTAVPGRVPMYVASEHVAEAQRQLDRLRNGPHAGTPIVRDCTRTAVAWLSSRRELSMGPECPELKGVCWQPLYAD